MQEFVTAHLYWLKAGRFGKVIGSKDGIDDGLENYYWATKHNAPYGKDNPIIAKAEYRKDNEHPGLWRITRCGNHLFKHHYETCEPYYISCCRSGGRNSCQEIGRTWTFSEARDYVDDVLDGNNVNIPMWYYGKWRTEGIFQEMTSYTIRGYKQVQSERVNHFGQYAHTIEEAIAAIEQEKKEHLDRYLRIIADAQESIDNIMADKTDIKIVHGGKTTVLRR